MRFIIDILIRISVWRFGAPRIIDRGGDRPYIVRYYLIGGDELTGRASVKRRWYDRLFTELFLQHFQRSDSTTALHNHPWRWAASLILRNGYVEERRSGDFISSHNVRRYNIIEHDTFHRVELDRGEAWTLFLAGPRMQDWGFWDRVTGQYTPHEQFDKENEDGFSETHDETVGKSEDEDDGPPPPAAA